MEGSYAMWMGQPVILRVMTDDLKVPLRGTLVSETKSVLKIRIENSWDVDIFKSMVIAIEQDQPLYILN
jgi:hypothetical protein